MKCTFTAFINLTSWSFQHLLITRTLLLTLNMPTLTQIDKYCNKCIGSSC